MKPFNESNPEVVKSYEKGGYALHGDVIVEMTSIPNNFDTFPKVVDNCLAHGEVTGHVHMLVDEGNFDLRECPETKVKYLRVVEPTSLKHQEHRPITLPPGTYRIGIQREYDPFEKLTRRVAD